MFDPKIHFAVIVHPARTLMTLTIILAVAVFAICLVGLWVLMEVAEFGAWLLHFLPTPLLLLGTLISGVLALAGILWLCREAYRFLMSI